MKDDEQEIKMRSLMKKLEDQAKKLSNEMLIYNMNVLEKEMQYRSDKQAREHQNRLRKIRRSL
jgi:hypothetical protein